MSGGRRGDRWPGRRPFLISLGAHLAVLIPFAALARAPEPIEMQTIRVNLVAAPPAAVEDQASQATASPPPQPEPEPVREEPQPEPEPQPQRPDPPPQRPPQERVERPRTETPPEPTPEPTREPPRRSSDAESGPTGGDALNINTEGREFPYPDYIANILNQVYRYFRWSDESRPKGVVYFEILQDGSVRGIRMHRSSGNIRFDFAVQGAVETAANRSAFGPLPSGFAAPFLPVTIEVEPPR